MNKLKNFVKTSLIGGIVVILPMAIFLFLFQWLFNLVTDLIQPLTDLVMKQAKLNEIFADTIVISIILAACFIVGAGVRTGVGRFLHESVENHILKVAPGYKTIKEIVMQFLGNKKAPFSSVVLVQLFENSSILVTGFVTDVHDNGYTVFVPTGPNPTSGNILHVKAEYVRHLDVSVEQAMRSIIGCGAGSAALLSLHAQMSTNGKNNNGL